MTTLRKLTLVAAVSTLALGIVGATPAADAAPANQFKSGVSSPPPPPGMGKLTAKPRVAKDKYCGPGQVPCDDIFTRYCTLIGGTMSKTQPWGGKTCFEPS